jgi:hypothetical protein
MISPDVNHFSLQRFEWRAIVEKTLGGSIRLE